MDVGRSFTYVTEDEEWIKKVLLGGVINLIPLVGQLFTFGYMIETLKNVIAGQETPLPEIGDFGGKLVEGLKGWVVAFVYALPLIIFSVCAQTVNVVPLIAENLDQDMVETLTTASVVVSACCGCLLLLYVVLMSLMLPFALGKYAETGQIGAALKLGEVFDMLKGNVGPAFIVLLISWVAIFVAELVGAIACGVGLLFTLFYAQLVIAFLYGALYRQTRTVAL
jgi:hypothetical protein